MEYFLNSLPCIIHHALVIVLVLVLARFFQPIWLACLAIREKKLYLKHEKEMQEERQEFEKQTLVVKNEHECKMKEMDMK